MVGVTVGLIDIRIARRTHLDHKSTYMYIYILQNMCIMYIPSYVTNDSAMESTANNNKLHEERK